jgi:two-component system phosphate regulon response regulator PhoB
MRILAHLMPPAPADKGQLHFAQRADASYVPPALRNVVYRYPDLHSFRADLHAADQELGLPPAEQVRDGEWVLAIFEIGEAKSRATAAAARGFDRGEEGFALAFERRDWERLNDFGESTSWSAFPAARPSAFPSLQPDETARLRIPTLPPVARLPTEPPPPSDMLTPSVRSLKAVASAHRGARLLLVDDDHDVRALVGTMLETLGLGVDQVESAEEALSALDKEVYDLVLLDWSLPGMHGLELCRHLRESDSFGYLPIVFLTSHSSSKDIVEAFAAGADDYVVKPFRAPELGARIFGLLRRARMADPHE